MTSTTAKTNYTIDVRSISTENLLEKLKNNGASHCKFGQHIYSSSYVMSILEAFSRISTTKPRTASITQQKSHENTKNHQPSTGIWLINNVWELVKTIPAGIVLLPQILL